MTDPIIVRLAALAYAAWSGGWNTAVDSRGRWFGENKHGELGSDARLWRKTPSTIPTLGLIAAAAALIVIGSYAHVSAPATEPISPVDWALKLARSSEQQGAYACTMRYWPNVTGTVSCQQDCD